jgi:hypothetical protein
MIQWISRQGRTLYYVPAHILVVIYEASAIILFAARFLPQNASFVDQRSENHRRWDRSDQPYLDPLDPKRECSLVILHTPEISITISCKTTFGSGKE